MASMVLPAGQMSGAQPTRGLNGRPLDPAGFLPLRGVVSRHLPIHDLRRWCPARLIVAVLICWSSLRLAGRFGCNGSADHPRTKKVSTAFHNGSRHLLRQSTVASCATPCRKGHGGPPRGEKGSGVRGRLRRPRPAESGGIDAARGGTRPKHSSLALPGV